jgi:hypothetical protein
MRSSTSLALATGVALAASLGLKAALVAAPAQPAVPRSLALRQFLAAHADSPVEPVSAGWSFSKGGCRLIAFPPGVRGLMDIVPQREVGPGDRLAYVYRGRLLDKPPTLAVGLDVLAYKAVGSLRGGPEPGYVALVVRGCPRVPDLPWAQLPS